MPEKNILQICLWLKLQYSASQADTPQDEAG